MYTLIKSIGKRKDEPRVWRNVDTTTLTLQEIYTNYKEFKILIEDEYMAEPEIFNLISIKAQYIDSTLTINQFLINNDNNALATYPGTLSTDVQYVKYVDAFRAGYQVDIVSQHGNIDSTDSIDDKTWLLLRKGDLDYTYFNKHCLTLVNGFLHFSETNNQGIFIKDGAVSRKICGNNTVGILSFKDLTTLKQKTIHANMIKHQADNPLSSRVVIDVGEDITNKTVMLSIGGYLVTPTSGLITLESENKIVINFNQYSLLDRFFESRKYIDYSSFNLDVPITNEDQFITDEIHSDSFIISLLTLPQSFIVIADNPDISFSKRSIRPSPMPGIYTSHEPPIYPLLIGNGMLANYWYTYQKPLWSINTVDGLWHKRQYSTTKVNSLLSLDDSRVPGDPVKWSKADYLLITTGDIQ